MVLIASAALVAGCSAGGSAGKASSASGGGAGGAAGAGGSGGGAAAAGGRRLTEKVAPGFATSTVWSSDLTWARKGIGTSVLGFSTNDAVSSWTVADQHAKYGMARVIGETVVVPKFASGGAAGDVQTTLEFLDAESGKPIATKALPAGSFQGLTADMVAGKPVVVAGKPVVVAHSIGAQSTTSATTTVFDTSGTQIWTSEGQPFGGNGAGWHAGLVADSAGNPLFVGGFTVRLNLGKDTAANSDASYDVLDLTGKSVLNIPFLADQWDRNLVSLVDGYAVVSYDDSLAQAQESDARQHFTVYDLVADAKKVGTTTEPVAATTLTPSLALAASGGKVLLSWMGVSPDSSGLALAPVVVAVFDTANGTTTAPAVLAGAAAPQQGVLVDPATSNVLLYDTSIGSIGKSSMISLTQGTVLWTQQDSNRALFPLSMHNGTLYGVEETSSDRPGRQLAAKESDGTPAGDGYELAPLAFTSGGSPVFMQAAGDSTDAVTVAVGKKG